MWDFTQNVGFYSKCGILWDFTQNVGFCGILLKNGYLALDQIGVFGPGPNRYLALVQIAELGHLALVQIAELGHLALVQIAENGRKWSKKSSFSTLLDPILAPYFWHLTSYFPGTPVYAQIWPVLKMGPEIVHLEGQKWHKNGYFWHFK